MVVINETRQAPETPPLNWGVVPRRYKVSDFMLFWIFSAFSAVIALGFLIPSVASGALSPTVSVGMVSLGVFLPMAAFSLIVIIDGLSQPAKEATKEAMLRADVWENYSLRPYLEDRFGVKFEYNESILNRAYGYFPSAKHEGRSIKVDVNGIKVYRNRFRFAPISHPSYVVNPKSISLSEVVVPKVITYKRIAEVHS